jgi:lipopolysaccharide export system protein LptA
LLLLAAGALGQKKSIVLLVKSNGSNGVKINGKDLIKVYQGTFKQDYSTLTSDSAYFYPQDNAVDAFGHVNINQGDTLNIYSDKLNYNGNTKVAILTDNVKMVDKDATLTTNHLTYNTATRIGIYTDGGKLVNKDNTLLSKNGYYFAFTRDSYFRYNVSLTTPDALVKTDTMRYNTKTRISYFYGPTNIYGTKAQNGKDKDTLYTENGNYNTQNEQAAFGKNNLYHSGTKSLKGDSLFYDKVKGYGRAVKHVTFDDKEQKTTIKGNLATYFKAQELTIVTEDPYVIMVTEQKDTSKTDSLKRDSIAKARQVVDKSSASKNKSGMNMADLIKQTIPAKTDPAATDQVKMTSKADSIIKKLAATTNPDSLKKAVIKNSAVITLDTSKMKLATGNGNLGIAKQIAKQAAALKADSAAKKLIAAAKSPEAKNAAASIMDKANLSLSKKNADSAVAKKDTGRIKRDSIYMSADTIETQILTYKDLKIYQEKQRLAHIRDTTSKGKNPKVAEKESKYLTIRPLKLPKDTSFYHRDYFGAPKPKPVKPVKPPTKQQLAADSLARKKLADSIAIAKKLEPNDTARIRIMIAHHHFKLFKSDLQSKADSMFYSGVDSTIRSFVNPIMWTEGSQLTGDTIYLQMKHKKLDNLRMFPNGFIVNIEKTDSTHFNQVAGKRMRGYFKDDKLYKMFVEGNAESIYFARDSGKMTISGIQRSLSSRIAIDFKDNSATRLSFYTKPENRYGPPDKFKDDEKILKGFIWKPKERPVSKESIIPSFSKKAAAAADKAAKGKSAGKKSPGGKAAKDSTMNAPSGKLPSLKAARDSVSKNLPGIKVGKDSTLKNVPVIKAGKDTVMKNNAVPPVIKAAKDSTIKTTPSKQTVVKTGKDSTSTKPAPIGTPPSN